MVRIRLPDTTEATLRGRRWTSANPRVERLLNAMIAPWGPSPDQVDVEAEMIEAKVVSKVLGATIIDQGERRSSG